MKKLLLLLLVIMGGVGSAKAATETTVYCAVSTNYTVKLNVNRGSDWNQYTMTKTNKTYNGVPIYSCTYTDNYGGVNNMQFQLYDGEGWKEQHQPYSDDWTANGIFNGMLYRYSEDDWVTYYPDCLRGDWDDWTDPIVFEDGVATVDFEATGYNKFKFQLGNTWYGAQNAGATMFWNNSTDWTFTSSNGQDCYIQVSAIGTYTFTLDATNKKISVTFPSYTPNEVYLYNNLGLAAAPYAYILQGANWHDDKGSGSSNQPKGVTMTQVGTSNVWKAEYPAGAHHGYIAFTQYLMDGYDNFNGGMAVYRGDFPSTSSVFVPNTSSNESKNGTTYYSSGEWHAYPTYTRSVTSGNYGTICLPFASTVNGANVYKIVSTVGDRNTATAINLEAVDALEAGKAYIFQATGSTLTATYTGGTYTAASDYNGMYGNLSPSSLTVPTSDGDYSYYVVKNNVVKKVVSGGSGVTVGQYKAYITLSNISQVQARSAISLGFEDEATGIESVVDVSGQNLIYNLNGQRVERAKKGLYVINGKKMLIK